MAPMVDVAEDQLVARRDEILHSVGLETYAEFRERSREQVLSDREWGARDELDSIAYLLGEDELTD